MSDEEPRRVTYIKRVVVWHLQAVINWVLRRKCAECHCLIGHDKGPKTGWVLENGSTVCNDCAVKDLKRIARKAKWVSDADTPRSA